MPEFNEGMSDSLDLQESLIMEVSNYMPMYGSVAGADRYFSEQIYGELWTVSTLSNKQKALMTATRAIDNLRFYGEKTSTTQPLEFPRQGASEPPDNIQRACYEEALARLSGIDSDTEYDNLRVESRVFGKVRTDYDTRHAPVHITSGIVSKRAWDYLVPYLDPATSVRLRRWS